MPSLEEDLAARLGRGEEVILATVIKLDGEPPSRTGAKLLMSRTATLAGTLGCSEFDAAALEDASRVADAGAPQLRTYSHDLGSIDVYFEPHAPAPTLVVFGATPVARALLSLAPELGFTPVLVETRPQRLTGGDWPPAITDLERLDSLLGPDVYAVHTDHDAPDLVRSLEVLLPKHPRFVGLVGSRRHTGHHLEALRAQGVDEGVIARIQSPVGLDIGALTPNEIALSILAGLIAKRQGRDGGWLQITPRNQRLSP
ncbi:MAG TPA: XdhC/CoxI family protein [Candidatus Dormibacteraeota bacterium]